MRNDKHISDKTYDLIRLFKNESNISNNLKDITNRIEELNPYEYLYFINEILFEVNITVESLKILFSFDMDEVYDVVDRISLRKEYSDLNSFEHLFDNLDVVERIFKLIHFKNTFLKGYESQLYRLKSKLNLLKEKEDIQVLSKVLDEVFEDSTDEYFPNHILYKHEEVSVFDKINNDIYLGFSYSDFNLIYQINDRLVLECKRAEILIDYSQKKINYNYQMLFPLLNSIDDWKKRIADDLISDSNDFEKRKLFYHECLDEYKRRTNQDFVQQILNRQKNIKEKIKYVENPDIFPLKNLKDWIDQTFSSFGRIKDLDLISVIDELPTKNKIIISQNFSQPLFLSILVNFFNELNFELNTSRMDALRGFVSNFIVFKEPIHHKKYIEKVPYSKIDFIHQKFYKDFIKIFLILHDPKNGIITSNITNTRELLTALFYDKKANQGLSYESIRRIKSLKFSKDVNSFKPYLRYVLSSIKRDYFLP